MRSITASIKKELLLLVRDKTGLLLLFLMPAVLVLVITLIQENVLKTHVDILFMDQDQGRVAREVDRLLSTAPDLTLVKPETPLSQAQAQAAVARGDYQFCIIIPKGAGRAVEEQARHLVRSRLFPHRVEPPPEKGPEVLLFFDPTLQGSYKSLVRTALERAIQAVELQHKLDQVFALIPEKIQGDLPPQFRSYLPEKALALDLDGADLFSQPLIHTRSRFATQMGFVTQPTPVQQNVPAWTIFGIFFIVLPVSGSLIKERDNGTLMKLRSMPVSNATLISGKFLAYVLVCLGQFALIWAIGRYVFPLFGADAFHMGPAPHLFFLVLFSTICAAVGYGILLGTVLKSYEQASLFGPVSIVIAAALSGIMVPVYVMPECIRPIASLFPLYWSQNAFYDLLLRQGDLARISWEIAGNFLFFATTLSLSLLHSFKENFKQR